jgi:hypothetical protein
MNNSNQNLYIDCHANYPDTVLYQYFDNKTGQQSNKVMPQEINSTGLVDRYCYEEVITKDNYLFPVDTIKIFVFDAQVLETTPWATVTQNYMILQRYDLSLADLQRLNWTLTYPPSEAMKDMKMYPPYER